MPNTNSVNVTFRSPADIARRIDALAAYSGHTRSAFLRLAVALADSSMTVSDTRKALAAGDESEEVQRVHDDARATLAEVLAALEPKPLFTASNN